jgi:hypothetical protein
MAVGVLNAEDHEFNPCLDKTKDYNLGILYFFKTNTALMEYK